MALTNAERQRRYRERKRAEQGKPVEPSVTPPVTSPVTRAVVTPDLPDLGARGRRLWREVTEEGGELRPAERVLLEEACRLADRLDRLHRILEGDDTTWARFRVGEDDTEVTVVLNAPLAEARQQQVALKQLLAELRQSRAGASGKSTGGRQTKPTTTGGSSAGAGITDLTARIARRSAPTG